MAQLESLTQRTRLHLETDVLIGRSSRCTLRIDDSRVSGEHANLRWNGECWLLKDLGSLNGTTVDGRALTPGESVILSEGAHIAFGHPSHVWTLADGAAPTAMALSLDGGQTVAANDGLLALPSPEQPLLTVHRDPQGAWWVEGEGATWEIADQVSLTAGGRKFRLCLPHVSARTTPLLGFVGRRVSELSISFHPSADLEHIEIEVACGGVSERLGARNHNEMLLVMARARTRDQERGLSEAECGWIYQDELCKALGLESDRLNVDVYRVRRQIAGLGLLDPASIIERRVKTRELRIGTSRLREASDRSR